jgi:hypothetical protein
MAKFNYTKLQTTASQMINKFGKSVNKISVTMGGSDWNPTETTVSTAIDGVITVYALNEIDGTFILFTDKKLLTTSQLTTADKIEDGGTTYTIVSIQAIEPANDAILYKVQLRR